MPKVKFEQSRPNEGYIAGQTYDLAEPEARHWIKRGYAAPVLDIPPSEAPESEAATDADATAATDTTGPTTKTEAERQDAEAPGQGAGGASTEGPAA